MSSYNKNNQQTPVHKKSSSTTLKFLSPVPFISSNVTNPLRSWCSVKFGDQKINNKVSTKEISKYESILINKALEKTIFPGPKKETGKKSFNVTQQTNKLPLAIVAPFKRIGINPHTDASEKTYNSKESSHNINTSIIEDVKAISEINTDINTQSYYVQNPKAGIDVKGTKKNSDKINGNGHEANQIVQLKTTGNSPCMIQDTKVIDNKVNNKKYENITNVNKPNQNETKLAVKSKDNNTKHNNVILPCNPGKHQNWIRDAKEESDTDKRVPIWARDKKSPLHSNIQKAKSLYDDMAKKQKEEENKSKSPSITLQNSHLKNSTSIGALRVSEASSKSVSPVNKVNIDEGKPQRRSTMENGTRHDYRSCRQQRIPENLPFEVVEDKSQSLPGYYRAPQSVNTKVIHLKSNKTNDIVSAPKEKVDNFGRSYKNLIGSFFHRKKKEQPHDHSFENSSTENDGGFIKNGQVNDEDKRMNSPYDNVIISASKGHNTDVIGQQKRDVYYPNQHNINRVFSNEDISKRNYFVDINNKYNRRQVTNIIGQRRLIPSISYDSLPASGVSLNSESAYGSINSLRSQSIGSGGRSTSMDTLTRKERKEAIMAKVQRIREKQADSSSDDDKASQSSVADSEKSFRSQSSSKKSKTSRTERYIRRKTYECKNLRNEAERDKRTKAIVEARINEIQKLKTRESKRNSKQKEKSTEKRWSANLVYQESNEYDAVVIPTPIPFSGELLTNDNVTYQNVNNIRTNKKVLANRLKIHPPEPPPRDDSRFLSPRELSRPFSYSFENISNRPDLYQSPPYSPQLYQNNSSSKVNSVFSFGHPNTITKRASSEQRLNQSQIPFLKKEIHVLPYSQSITNIPPPKPQRASVIILPKNSLLVPRNQGASQTNISADINKGGIIHNLPPSPSSDYASYISENSSMVTNISSPRPLSREEFREKVLDSSYEQPVLLPKMPLDNEDFSYKKPDPPKRNCSSFNKRNKEIVKQQLKQALENSKDPSEEHKKIEEAYKQERERIIRSKCSNLKQAITELEEIYNSLNLNSDDLLDGAERRDLPTEHQLMWANNKNSLPNSAQNNESKLRSCTPDKITDDVHYRRCRQRTPKPVDKQNLPSSSYMLFSPIHSPTLDAETPCIQDDSLCKEPNVVSDDVTYRNAQRANSIRIIDPQPPFGIPVGPTTQGSISDYLHIQPKENYKPILSSRKYPDVSMDDMAFRNLRKDNSHSEKCLNLSELDSILSETDGIRKPRRNLRSISVDRISHKHFSDPNIKSNQTRAPRNLRNIKRKNIKAKFYESYRGALSDIESSHSKNETLENDKCKTYTHDFKSPDCVDSSTETLRDQAVDDKIKLTSNIINDSKFAAGLPNLDTAEGEDNPFTIYNLSPPLYNSDEHNAKFQDVPTPFDVIRLTNLISTIKNTDNNLASDKSKLLKENKSVDIRSTSNSTQRKANAVSLIEQGNIKEGNVCCRRYSSIDVSNSNCFDCLVNDVSYIAVSSCHIPGPSKPDKLLIEDGSSQTASKTSSHSTDLAISCTQNEIQEVHEEISSKSQEVLGFIDNPNYGHDKHKDASTFDVSLHIEDDSTISENKKNVLPEQNNIDHEKIFFKADAWQKSMCQGESSECHTTDILDCSKYTVVYVCFLLCMFHVTGVDIFTAISLILAIITVFLTFFT